MATDPNESLVRSTFPVTNPCTRPGDNPGSHRKHTPIVSEKQRGMMGAELARRREGKKGRLPSMTTAELRGHLKESKGKNLPERSRA